MAVPVIAAVVAVVAVGKIVQSVYTWSRNTPQGKALTSVAVAAAANHHARSAPNDRGAQLHAHEANKRMGEDFVTPAVQNLVQHVRKDLGKA
ncbi:hypothetical protein [Streptomyces sp. NRRL B-24484]|uniref:hypothetical protein n=1 Tax=Streptomyces sp. NRRL B-24484 TaxID=1463833 RepID=UPI0004BF6867|nr:hypothetical protein [Streptomyces sp. NRRL B-24484]